MTSTFYCRVCTNQEKNRSFTVIEMMFGLKDAFEYFECNLCGCVQIATIPGDLSRYYPSNYYSFQRNSYVHRPLRILLKKQLIRYHIYKEATLLGKLFSYRFPKAEDFYSWVERAKLSFGGAVLDVGCGSGQLLLRFLKSGYTNLIGVDPFIEKDIHYPGDVVIYKKALEDMSGTFDLIIFNHSLEHMPDQAAALKDALRLLRKGGCVLVRIPIAGTYAWRTYGANWIQLDAPRHLYLHTVTSIKKLAMQLGFERIDIEYDSNASQFWGSEQIQRGIPLRDQHSYAESPSTSIFSSKQIERWSELASKLNKQEDGDQASFFLYNG